MRVFLLQTLKRGCAKLISLLERFETDISNVIIGMESTSYYWISPYSYLLVLDLRYMSLIRCI